MQGTTSTAHSSTGSWWAESGVSKSGRSCDPWLAEHGFSIVGRSPAVSHLDVSEQTSDRTSVIPNAIFSAAIEPMAGPRRTEHVQHIATRSGSIHRRRTLRLVGVPLRSCLNWPRGQESTLPTIHNITKPLRNVSTKQKRNENIKHVGNRAIPP